MSYQRYIVEAPTAFADSMIWDLNRQYYESVGIKAWQEGTVPHNMTSNSMVGKTYSELIYGFLKDLAAKGQTEEKVYIVELGAGHGRLAFHILKHLDKLIETLQLNLPPFCYVLTDFAENNLTFFKNHPQFKTYFDQGKLDVAFFDAVNSTTLELAFSKEKISPNSLEQPLLAIGNYFFDSIPTDVFYLKNAKVSACTIALETTTNPEEMDAIELLKNIQTIYHNHSLNAPYHEDDILNEMLKSYQYQLFDTYLFFPTNSFTCIENLKKLSKSGLMLLMMDKGYYDIHDLESVTAPDMVVHGAMSFWVNFHAMGMYCQKKGGQTMFSTASSFDLELGCLMFLPESETYTETKHAYQRFVNDFGPDDYNGVKEFSYHHIAKMTLPQLIAVVRLSAYDSTYFINVLPRIKQLSTQITFEERTRLAETMHKAWDMYFTLNESFDLPYEIGGLFYDMGFYTDALKYFNASVEMFGQKADVFYNLGLCYYQLRDKTAFSRILNVSKALFPDFQHFDQLGQLEWE